MVKEPSDITPLYLTRIERALIIRCLRICERSGQIRPLEEEVIRRIIARLTM